MAWIKFLTEYVKSPRTVGALAPSSPSLAEKMVNDIDFRRAKCIVEYGPGTGVFTEKLISNKRSDTLLILFEYNERFYKQLSEKYNDVDNLTIINDSAEYIEKYLKQYNIEKVDYIVSGLPFASLPKSVSNKILESTQNVLRKGGLFITFQYTLLKKDYIENYFSDISYNRVFINLPPAYVLKCENG
ncbi:MAG: rRNA adenine N-6-methyltransferase family protein [Bacillota bacterium]|nr:rRNA adenine N-6-methyltransferase family protein [Bacillota bacterium]